MELFLKCFSISSLKEDSASFGVKGLEEKPNMVGLCSFHSPNTYTMSSVVINLIS